MLLPLVKLAAARHIWILSQWGFAAKIQLFIFYCHKKFNFAKFLMDKNSAKLYDALLTVICKNPDASLHISRIAKEAQAIGFNNYMEVKNAIATFLEDGFIDFIRHPNIPEHDFGIYTATNKGIKFINHEGGYAKRRRYDNYNKTNIKFTWIRHWVWFYTAIASLILNLYFIARYLLKLI